MAEGDVLDFFKQGSGIDDGDLGLGSAAGSSCEP